MQKKKRSALWIRRRIHDERKRKKKGPPQIGCGDVLHKKKEKGHMVSMGVRKKDWSH